MDAKKKVTDCLRVKLTFGFYTYIYLFMFLQHEVKVVTVEEYLCLSFIKMASIFFFAGCILRDSWFTERMYFLWKISVCVICSEKERFRLIISGFLKEYDKHKIPPSL